MAGGTVRPCRGVTSDARCSRGVCPSQLRESSPWEAPRGPACRRSGTSAKSLSFRREAREAEPRGRGHPGGGVGGLDGTPASAPGTGERGERRLGDATGPPRCGARGSGRSDALGGAEGSGMDVPLRGSIFKPMTDPQVRVSGAGTRRAGLPAAPPCPSNPRSGECPRVGVRAPRCPARSHPAAPRTALARRSARPSSGSLPRGDRGGPGGCLDGDPLPPASPRLILYPFFLPGSQVCARPGAR